MLDEKLLVFVLGAPGAGKGTQCDLIVKQYGWTHISAGDLLRAQVAAGTPAGKEAEEYLKQGTMVPASMIIGLLKEALSDAQHTKVLIDGFPRVLDQLKEFERQVRPCDKALFYNVPEEAARDRLLKRGETSGRIDDNAETIRTRFVVFKEESMPVITELETEGRAAEIDASQPPEEVFKATRLVIEQLQQLQQQKTKNKPEQGEVTAAAPSTSQQAATPAAEAQTPAAAVLVAAAAPAPALPSAGAAVDAASAAQSPKADTPPAVAVSPAASPAGVAAVAANPQQQTPALVSHGVSTTGHGHGHGHGLSSPLAVVLPAVPTTSVSAATIAAALPAAAAMAAAASSPQKSAVPQAAVGSPSAAAVASDVASVASPAAAAIGMQPEAAATTAGPARGAAPVPAAAVAATSPKATATIASLQVDLSGIRTPVVICGPSGVGKGTLISKLMTQFADTFGFSVSHTTRSARPGEEHGKHYYFTAKEAMAAQVAAGMFLEHAVVHGNMYGTSLAAVAQVSAAGKHCVLDIDVQGAAQVRKSALGSHCLFIFVAPPSHEELERRLRNRGTETEDKVLQRLANAESEIAKAQEPGVFHHVLVNADLETAYQELVKLINPRVPGLLLSTPGQQQQQATGLSSQRVSEAGSLAGAGGVAAAAAAAGTDGAVASSPVAPGAAVLTADAGAASVGAAVLAASQQQQQQLLPALANGNIGSSCNATAAGGTATLLDFGFGANTGPATVAKGMPVRQYMDATVIPVLREGLKALNVARPDDPLQFLADYLVAHKAAAC